MGNHKDFLLASDPETSQDTLENLSRSSSELVRGAVALNPSTSEKTLLYLIGDNSRHVARCLAKNKFEFSKSNIKVAVCRHVKLRLATVNDAEFILSLRIDNNLNKFLSPVDDDIIKQRAWLASYEEREKKGKEFYFIITIEEDVPQGVLRLYDFKGDSFCAGSWIVRKDAPIYTAIESILSAYEFAFHQLGFQQSRLDVRKGNLKVIKFHKSFGAKVVLSDADNYYFKLLKSDYKKARKKYRRFFL